MTHGYEWFLEYDFVDLDMDFDFDNDMPDNFDNELEGYEEELLGYA